MAATTAMEPTAMARAVHMPPVVESAETEVAEAGSPAEGEGDAAADAEAAAWADLGATRVPTGVTLPEAEALKPQSRSWAASS
jgi:hypothetical protein